MVNVERLIEILLTFVLGTVIGWMAKDVIDRLWG
jgi:hypothetical protein